MATSPAIAATARPLPVHRQSTAVPCRPSTCTCISQRPDSGSSNWAARNSLLVAASRVAGIFERRPTELGHANDHPRVRHGCPGQSVLNQHADIHRAGAEGRGCRKNGDLIAARLRRQTQRAAVSSRRRTPRPRKSHPKITQPTTRRIFILPLTRFHASAWVEEQSRPRPQTKPRSKQRPGRQHPQRLRCPLGLIQCDPITRIQREQQPEIEEHDLQPRKPVRDRTAARPRPCRLPQDRQAKIAGKPLDARESPRRSSPGNENCSEPATCRNREAQSAYENRVATSSVDMRESARTSGTATAELPTMSSGRTRRPTDIEQAGHQQSETADQAEPPPDLATPEPGRPCPRHWRTRRKPRPRPGPPGRSLAEPADTGATGIVPQFLAGRSGKNADVLVRTGVNTVQAERAIHVARLPRLVQVAARIRECHRRRGCNPWCGTSCTRSGVANLYFQRRNQRLHEIELADRTDILAEGCTAKETVDHESSRKIGQNEPGRPPRAVPESKRLVSPEKQRRASRPPAICSATSAASSGPAAASAARASAAA